MGDYGLSLATNISGLQSKFHASKLQFSTEPPARTMQDEINDRSVNKQPQQSDKSNNGTNNQNVELNRIQKSENSDLNYAGLDEKRLSNPLQGLEQPSTSTAVKSSHSNDSELWSNSIADDSYLHGYQSLNGSVAFQQFPPSQGGIYSNAVSSHMGVNLQQNRRAITAQHNFQKPQQSMILNSNAKPFSNNWNSQQQQWSTVQNQPPAMASWNNMTQPGQRRSMPNMNPFLKKSSISQQFASQAQILAPSKFRRSTSFPGQMHQAAMMKPNFDHTPAIDDLQRDSVLNYQVCYVLPGNGC